MERVLLSRGQTGAVQTGAVTTATIGLRRDGALIDTAGFLQLTSPVGVFNFGELSDGVRRAVHRLVEEPVCDLDLAGVVTGFDGELAVLRLQVLLRRLDSAGWLEHTVVLADRPLATLRPLGRGGTTRGRALDPAIPVTLSRFVVIHSEGGRLLAESPRSHLAVELIDTRAVALLGALVQPVRPADVDDGTIDLPPEATRAVLRLLNDAGLLVNPLLAGEESTVQALAQWSVADLLMHARSRAGRSAVGYGGTYWLADRFPPLPVSAMPRGGVTLELPAIDMAAIAAGDAAMTTVLERRRSIRRHDDGAPITLGQLAELLYRSVRNRRTMAAGDDAAGHDAVCDRPYPSGGALHELEVYPVVTNCPGVAPGLWHYLSDAHALELVRAPSPAMEQLVVAARAASMMASDPQVLLVVTARFGRVMWKYQSMAYGLVLKDVGVLYQTLYLVATAMGLAPCALGGGDSDAFAAASGLDYYTEGSVGEFLIGSRPRADTGDGPVDAGAAGAFPPAAAVP